MSHHPDADERSGQDSLLGWDEDDPGRYVEQAPPPRYSGAGVLLALAGIGALGLSLAFTAFTLSHEPTPQDPVTVKVPGPTVTSEPPASTVTTPWTTTTTQTSVSTVTKPVTTTATSTTTKTSVSAVTVTQATTIVSVVPKP